MNYPVKLEKKLSQHFSLILTKL